MAVVVEVVVVVVVVEVMLMFDDLLESWGWSSIHCLRVFRHKRKTRDGPINAQTNPFIEMVMVLTVIFLVSDNSQGPRIGESFIIYAFSVIKKNAGQTNGPTDRRTDGRTNPLIEMRGRI